jgi:hypothetical protein
LACASKSTISPPPHSLGQQEACDISSCAKSKRIYHNYPLDLKEKIRSSRLEEEIQAGERERDREREREREREDRPANTLNSTPQDSNPER